MNILRCTALALFVAAWLPSGAQRTISSFREVKITYGETALIDGVERSEPDIYYVPVGDGTYEAVRLTVAPPSNSRADITQPYLYMNTPHSIKICWKTSARATPTQVHYGKTADDLDLVCTATETRVAGTYYWYTASLTDLEPASEYYYRVESGGTEGEVYRFRTMPEPDGMGKMRVLFIGDHQRNEHSDYEWLLNAARAKMAEKCGDAPFEDQVGFIMNVGDQVDAGRSELYERVHLFKSRSVSPTLPTMTAVGNHEYADDSDLSIYKAHYDYAEIEYQGISSGTDEYYAYQAGPVLFVVLNSDNTNTEQKMWVRKVVAAAATDDTVDFIVSVQHRPLYAEQWTYDTSPWMLNEIMPILSSTPKHVLNCGGHHHLYARGQMTETPVYHIISGGGVGTSASGYEQLWGTTPDNRNVTEVQKTLDHWTYQIFEFDADTKEMTVETYSIGNARLALDNVLVDKFTRRTTDNVAPDAPTLADVPEVVSLPHVFAQAPATSKVHSTNWQISKNADFTDVVVDQLMAFEDMYGVDDDYMPLDLNKDKDITTYSLADGTLADGTYYVRVRNRNMNLDWSEFSAPVKFTIEGASAVPMVATDARFYRTGSEVTISYDGAPVGTEAWVGIYVEGKTPGTSDLSYSYAYTSGVDGTWRTSISDPGVYFAVLFKDGGYTEITERVHFIVSDNCDDANLPQIATDSRVYEVGDPVVVNYTNATCINKDWIGIYERSKVPSSSVCPTYLYVSGAPNGSVTLNVSGTVNFSSALPAGIYFAGYFNADGYYEPIDRVYFVVGKPVMLDTDRREYAQGDRMTVVYDGTPAWEGMTLAVYCADGKVGEEGLDAEQGGALTIETQSLAPGNYELAVLCDGVEVSERLSFVVLEPTAIAAVDAERPRVSLDGNVLSVASDAGIDRIDIYSADGVRLKTGVANGADKVSVAVDSGSGVYIVSVDGRSGVKFMKK